MRVINDNIDCGARTREADIWRWLGQITSALQHLHKIRVLHRDIKPANVFLTRDRQRTMLGDFGIAKACVFGAGSDPRHFSDTFMGPFSELRRRGQKPSGPPRRKVFLSRALPPVVTDFGLLSSDPYPFNLVRRIPLGSLLRQGIRQRVVSLTWWAETDVIALPSLLRWWDSELRAGHMFGASCPTTDTRAMSGVWRLHAKRRNLVYVRKRNPKPKCLTTLSLERPFPLHLSTQCPPRYHAQNYPCLNNTGISKCCLTRHA